MSVVVRYTLLRLSLLLAVGLLLYAVGARGVLWLLLTAVVSVAASYVLLRRPREQVTQALVDRQEGRTTSGRRSRLAEDAAAEDADVERREGPRRHRDDRGSGEDTGRDTGRDSDRG
ncbi:DUF4229 domain-containing protein [Pseudokineococcus basanitobsidens]|uniref:DUF4229 domain-containing protein n=1 Tax=Pseudokineococcus basanitobsidens TaxID=1926649 RepID=A0ABU8RH02_9ACTN